MGVPTDPEQPLPIERLPAALSTPEAWLDPFDWYATMREEAPIRYDESRECWDVFRYADVDAVLDDPSTFSSDPRQAPGLELPPSLRESPIMETMLRTEGDRHRRLRGVVEESFRPRALVGRAGRFESLAVDLLDGAVDDGEMDVVETLAYPFPVTVIAELLGIPSADRPQFREWSETLVASPTETGADALDEFRRRREETTRDLIDYFETKLAGRAEDRRDDLLTTVVRAEEEGRLSHEEAIGLCMLLLIAGNITTTNLIGNAMRCLTARPDLLARLEAERHLIDGAVEETLRYRSPVQAVTRFVATDAKLDGHRIAAGDAVVAWVGSANRDPATFDDPDAFDPSRSPNPHLGFGRGAHYCLGAPLARMEAKIALGALFERITDVERATDDLHPVRSAFIHGVESFPITFTPRADRRES